MNSAGSVALVARLESIVPLAMELVAFDGQFCQFLVRDFDPGRIGGVVERVGCGEARTPSFETRRP